MIDIVVEPADEIEKMIVEYMSRYPSFYFRSTMLSRKFGISPQKISKILLFLYNSGQVDRFIRGNGKNIRAYYKALNSKDIDSTAKMNVFEHPIPKDELNPIYALNY
ncbi:MAG: hypothetical protein QW292_14905 [Candidatus Parvarchaeota archaeon]